MSRRALSLGNAWFVTALFAVITVAATWPLATVLGTEIAWDLGDPVFNCWIMMWTGGQVLRFITGDWSALGDFWNGNIFYPERLTIAYSEHLTPQMLQILPVYALTGNMVLCYNLLFLSAIVLSALGMYLLIRELTGQPLAAFVAGVAFAFSPYRVDQFAHLQVMSSQWMPLALYGFRRYFTGGHLRALIGATTAVVVQVLSCFYFLFFFAPFAAAYCLYEMVVQRRWRDSRVWVRLSIAGIVALLVIAPFLLPYMKVRDVAGMGVREAKEIATFSADTWALATASENLTFWGPRLQTFPRPEGDGFPGFTILLLGLAGIAVVAGKAAAHARATSPGPSPSWRRASGVVVLGLIVVAAAVWIAIFVNGPTIIRPFGLRIPLRDLQQISLETAAVLGIAALYPFTRRFMRGVPGSASGFLVVGWIGAVLLAFGPVIRAHGNVIGPGPYVWLLDYVPGFNGMRVPARFMMVATLFLTALGGIAMAALAARWRRVAYVIAVLAIGGILTESAVTPFITNKRLWVEHFDLAPRHLATEATMGAVYEKVRDLPTGTVLAEFPYGSPPFDIQATFYAGLHGKPLVNGFSGFFPKRYLDRIPSLGWDPDRATAWQTLVDSGATHVVVHEAAYFDDKGAGISNWLRNSGAREIAVNGTDRLFALK